MRISNIKKKLAKIIYEGGGWIGGEFASQEKNGDVCFYPMKPKFINGAWNGATVTTTPMRAEKMNHWHIAVISEKEYAYLYPHVEDGWIRSLGERPCIDGNLFVDVKFRNGKHSVTADMVRVWTWRHCYLEFDIVAYRLHKPEQAEPQYCESVTRAIPEPVTAPTLDQLLQDYRNASDFAAAKQAEADEAAKMRDGRWKAAQARACELGVRISVEMVVDAEMCESEPVITDWRDLRVGDIVMVVGCSNNPGWSRLSGVELEVVAIGYSKDELCFKPKDGELWYCGDNTRWVFIRRP